ncbi:hypothetical protein [Bradyrhizobium sp. AZCC 1708]|uniref:hypothetical protein n=1 Tax=Bradyrhizobium sp. AZCC 1708 TaxID=3117015 RepID=UPI002FF21B41
MSAMVYSPPTTRTKEKSGQELTVSAKAPVLSETTQIVNELRVLRQALEDPASEQSLQTLRTILPKIEKLRARWRAVDQPATYAQITEEMLRLAVTMPNAGNIDQQILVRTLCEDMVELRPSVFVLERACRAHRRKAKYLSFHELAKEVERLSSEAQYLGKVVRTDFRKSILEFEKDLLEQQQEEEEERLREERQKARQRYSRELKRKRRRSGCER